MVGGHRCSASLASPQLGQVMPQRALVLAARLRCAGSGPSEHSANPCVGSGHHRLSAGDVRLERDRARSANPGVGRMDGYECRSSCTRQARRGVGVFFVMSLAIGCSGGNSTVGQEPSGNDAPESEAQVSAPVGNDYRVVLVEQRSLRGSDAVLSADMVRAGLGELESGYMPGGRAGKASRRPSLCRACDGATPLCW